jgi:hypothetical protein
MWRVAVLVSALTLLPSVAAARQSCTADVVPVIEQVYRQVLERAADPGASGWADRLARGATVRDIIRGVAKSPEHLQLVGRQSRDGMVSDVYRHLLNRGPDPEGMKNAEMAVSMRGFAGLVDQLVDSPEYRGRFGDWTVPGSNVRYCAGGSEDTRDIGNSTRGGESATRLPAIDTNNDGVISRREWRGSRQAFSTRDWNNDGVLSGDELSVAVPRRQPPSRQRWPQ